jgi:ribosomal protein S18
VWVARQRQRYKEGTLSDERREKLEAIKGWEWEKMKKVTWNEAFELLKDFIEEQGRMASYKDEFRGMQLGKWIDRQRQAHKNGKLSEERVSRLNCIENWSWGRTNMPNWNEMLDILHTFVQEHNRIPKYSERYQMHNLGNWVHRQRQAYGKNTLTQERIKKLISIPGWTW